MSGHAHHHHHDHDHRHDHREPTGAKLALVDIPLLYEGGHDYGLDRVAVTAAEPATYRKRALSRPGDRAVVGGAELTVYVTAPEPDLNPDSCIRSGWCVEGCPVRIHPAGLLEAAQADDAELAEEYGLAACIECGICNFVCPSRLPLLEGIRTLRRRGLGR